MFNFSIFVKKKYLILFALTIFLTACSSKNNGYKLEKITSCYFPDNPSQAAPMWLCDFNIEGYPITGVGSIKASKAGIQFMTQQAAAHARVSMAQELRTFISNEISNYMKSENLGNEEKIKNVASAVTSQITEAVLIGSKILRTTTSANGTLYVLVGLNPENYQATLKNVFNKAMPAVKKTLSAESFKEISENIINK